MYGALRDAKESKSRFVTTSGSGMKTMLKARDKKEASKTALQNLFLYSNATRKTRMDVEAFQRPRRST